MGTVTCVTSMVGFRAAGALEPRQVREEAAIRGVLPGAAELPSLSQLRRKLEGHRVDRRCTTTDSSAGVEGAKLSTRLFLLL